MTVEQLADLIESKLSGEYPWTSGDRKDRYLQASADGDIVRVGVHDTSGREIERFTVRVSTRGLTVRRLPAPAVDFEQAA